MRAYVGGLIHETNAFSPIPTTLASYGAGVIGYRDLLSAARDAGFEVTEGLSLRAAPSAPTQRADYEALRQKLVADIRKQAPFDAVLLSLHGAQVAEGYPDCEGDLLGALREALGEDVCIAVLLDLHASVSQRMLALADLVVSIKEYPHTDYPVSAQQLAGLARRMVAGEIAPVTAFVPLPVYTLWHTPEQPCRAIVDEALAYEARGDVLHISLVHGFPWSDVEDAGAAVIVVTDADEQQAVALARAFARKLWAIRAADLEHYRTIEQCMARVAEHSPGTLVIADAADNPGAGCGGDSTWLLQALLDAGVQDAAFAMLVDADAVAAACQAGVGAEVRISLGGYSSALAGAPVVATATVVAIAEPARIDAMPGYPPVQVDCLVRLSVQGVDVVVCAYREQVFGPGVFTEVGIDPGAMRVLVVKSAQHFYNAFAPLAADVLYVDAPCSRSIDFSSLPFRSRRAPVWPLEELSESDIPQPLVF
ncbi:MAG: M81 family metallopeptidase [Halieaceae bacterium]|nr:M81 family metallopeptidase [Halieaceae bacterium]